MGYGVILRSLECTYYARKIELGAEYNHTCIHRMGTKCPLIKSSQLALLNIFKLLQLILQHLDGPSDVRVGVQWRSTVTIHFAHVRRRWSRH